MRRLVSPYRLFSVALLWLALAPSGCAGPNSIAAGAPRIPFEQLDQKHHAAQLMGLSEQPVVIHFKEGQEIPFNFVLDSRLLSLTPPDMKLRVKTAFFLLLRADGPPLLSEDGVEFEEQPKNSFMLGFEVQRDKPPALNLRLGVRSNQPEE